MKAENTAVVYSEKQQVWYVNSMMHRVNGPVAIRHYGYEAWYLNGKEVALF